VIVALDGVRRKDVFVDRGNYVFATLARKDLPFPTSIKFEVKYRKTPRACSTTSFPAPDMLAASKIRRFSTRLS
jgi:hypothetical protein